MVLSLNVSDQCAGEEDVIFWSLGCYGVTISILLINFVTILVGFFIILFNCVVITAVLKRYKKDETRDIVIASLALADAILGLFVIYHTAYNVGNWQVFEECMFRYGILLAANLSSVLHMAFLTLDCYIKIVRPYLYQRVMKRARVIKVSSILWLLSLVWGCLPILGWNPGQSSDQTPVCGFFIITDPSYRLIMWFLFMFPLLKNMFLYGHIFRIARRHATSIGLQTGSRVSRKTWRFTKTVVLVIGFYFLCWTPSGVFLLIEYCGYLDHISPSEKGSLMVYVTILGYINSLLNPLIYALKIAYIKQRFAQMFGRIFCCPCFRLVTNEDSNTTVVQYSSSTAAGQVRDQAEESLPNRPEKTKAKESSTNKAAEIREEEC